MSKKYDLEKYAILNVSNKKNFYIMNSEVQIRNTKSRQTKMWILLIWHTAQYHEKRIERKKKKKQENYEKKFDEQIRTLTRKITKA